MTQHDTITVKQICPHCGGHVDTSEADPLSIGCCPHCGDKFRVDKQFDHFVLLEPLGAGGMGSVYKARDTLLGRLVALKIFRRDLGSDTDRAAHLQEEARAAAAINHPNVVQIFSFGRDRGQFYLVMELVDGGSLDERIEKHGRLAERDVLRAGIEVTQGLRAAQAKGLIHRDVKPGNVLFAADGTVKISDFGLAGAATQPAGRHTEIWGSPYYVSPERLLNQPEDFRGDIYSLGATLYHALYGSAPIRADSNSTTALIKLKQQPLKLRQTGLRISPLTRRLLRRMLAGVPAKRFASYDELLAALNTALMKIDNGRTRSPARRTFGRLAAAAALIICAAATAAVIVATNTRTAPQQIVQRSAGPTVEIAPQAQPPYETYQPVDATRQLAQWVIDWKRTLIDDLNRTGFSGALDIAGTQYTGIAGADNEQIMFRTRVGITGVRWDHVPPKTLLAISAAFIWPENVDAADRQWLCAAFAYETGQLDAGRQFAEAAAKSKAAYREYLGIFSQTAAAKTQ